MRRSPRLLILVIFILALSGGIFLAIKIAKGYRPSSTNKSLEGTGLLSANSIPKGASVFINNKLTTATDDTINLPPGEYQVKIAQDGYLPWEKTLKLQPELVTQTNARIFPAVPDLKPLTFSGAINPTPSPDGQKIVFGVMNATSDTKNGLYVLDLQDRAFTLNSDPKQITRNSPKYDFVNSNITWSPDSAQILVTLNLNKPEEQNILLNPNAFNDAANYKDITARLPVTIKEWQELINKKNQENMLRLPEFMQTLATESAKLTYFSPDDKMFLYTATKTVTIPDNLLPALPASSTQKEDRNLQPDKIYIYDLEEDKNFLIGNAPAPSPSPKSNLKTKIVIKPADELEKIRTLYSPIKNQLIQWFPDSRHVIMVEENKLTIAEYDNTNRQTVYAGPFSQNFAYPWPNGSRLIILSSLNGSPDLPPNLYSINLK